MKPRMVPVPDEDVREMLLGTENVLSTPHLTKSGGKFYADPDDLRLWRASQDTSEVKP